MTSPVVRAQLETLFGNCCPLPAIQGTGTPEVSVGTQDFSKLAAYWKELPAETRPRLLGLTVSRDAGAPRLRMVMSASDTGILVLVSTEFLASAGKFPRLHEIWPYAGWWVDELRGFEKVEIPERRDSGGVSWQLS
jgi:hypothetical protein